MVLLITEFIFKKNEGMDFYYNFFSHLPHLLCLYCYRKSEAQAKALSYSEGQNCSPLGESAYKLGLRYARQY